MSLMLPTTLEVVGAQRRGLEGIGSTCKVLCLRAGVQLGQCDSRALSDVTSPPAPTSECRFPCAGGSSFTTWLAQFHILLYRFVFLYRCTFLFNCPTTSSPCPSPTRCSLETLIKTQFGCHFSQEVSPDTSYLPGWHLHRHFGCFLHPTSQLFSSTSAHLLKHQDCVLVAFVSQAGGFISEE